MPDHTDFLTAKLKANLELLHLRVAAACQRAGREVDSVTLVAVTKSVQSDVIEALVRCGQSQLAENRPQQLIERAGILNKSLGDLSPPSWHLIGQLQSNKIRSILPWVTMIHSVDSFKQLERIGRISQELSVSPSLLLEINVSGETTKGGFSPMELKTEWEAIRHVMHTRISGLMTMAPLTEDMEIVRSAFRGLRELRDELQQRSPGLQLHELSMGMSNDFEIAIEEGSTLIRVGSLLFEGLNGES